MCGIIGLVFSKEKNCTQALIDALTILQHRGQDAAGIVTIRDNRLNLRKDLGTVADVFTQENVLNLEGNVGIGHVRYPTAGGSCSAEAQPLYTNSPFGIALAHNGNLTNTDELIVSMEQEHRHINTKSDSELLLNVFAEELQRRRLRQVSPDELFDAVRSVMRRCKGGYAVVMLINRVGLVAFRDPNGIRPLCFGARKTAEGTDYAIASESVAIDALDPNFKLIRDVGAGEAVFITMDGELYTHQVHPSPKLTPCMFEYVYFARPDSVIDGVPVYEARQRMGEKLAKKIIAQYPDYDIDIVMPIPETSRTAALACAFELKRPYREGFIKNRYIARTFIMPGQEMRRKTVRLKLNTIKSEFKDKNILLIDDSIVRGTTSMELVQLAREAGAKGVWFASAAPPVRYPNVYGIDIPTRAELIAHGRNEEEIAAALHADKVIYNDLDAVVDAVRSLNPTVLTEFDNSCFSGLYVTDEITEEYLEALEISRGKGRKGASASSGAGAGVVAPDKDSKSPNSKNHQTMQGCGTMMSGGAESLANEVGRSVSKTVPLKRTDSGSCEGLHNNILRSAKGSESAPTASATTATTAAAAASAPAAVDGDGDAKSISRSVGKTKRDDSEGGNDGGHDASTASSSSAAAAGAAAGVAANGKNGKRHRA